MGVQVDAPCACTGERCECVLRDGMLVCGAVRCSGVVIYCGGVCVPKLLLNLPVSLLLHHPLIDALTNGLDCIGRSMV